MDEAFFSREWYKISKAAADTSIYVSEGASAAELASAAKLASAAELALGG
jgi:hypothetical protein